ncbi:hypothetical protein AB4144_44530, partial [Rhizobiaceae sp. 2RAB30]
ASEERQEDQQQEEVGIGHASLGRSVLNYGRDEAAEEHPRRNERHMLPWVAPRKPLANNGD